MIVKMKFGSHLYGTNSETSDLDIKGIAFDNPRNMLLNKFSKHIEHSSTGSANSKNTKEDVDVEIFTLHTFIKHALDGQTVAFDMLHAPESMLLKNSPVWEEIVKNREKFYSKNIHSFIGYVMQQTAKYSMKGSRLDSAEKVINFLKQLPQESKLKDNDLSLFPIGEHIVKSNINDIILFDICGKKFQDTVKVSYALDIIQKFYDNYGARAKLAQMNQGIDWKAISHALRVAFQVKELLTEHTITFPLKERELIKKVKYGQLKFEKTMDILEPLVDELKIIKNNSRLPEKPDYMFWENFLLDTYKDKILELYKGR